MALTVPAFPALWSKFDEQVGHHRRYTRQTLEAAIEASGIEPDGTTYFFSWLAPAVWATRRRDRVEADAVAPGAVGRAVSAVVSWLCRAERAHPQAVEPPVRLVALRCSAGRAVRRPRERSRNAVKIDTPANTIPPATARANRRSRGRR